MNTQQKTQLIIDQLGFNGATHTLRVSKERLNRFREGQEPFTATVEKFANKTLKHLEEVPSNKAPLYILNLYYGYLNRRRGL